MLVVMVVMMAPGRLFTSPLDRRKECTKADAENRAPRRARRFEQAHRIAP
ncbi:MAG: hypothetical protein IT338_18730 [Thermomicrobiales bacterium]|nr:hypothetical protein [Thermomicrobiales bacterium]